MELDRMIRWAHLIAPAGRWSRVRLLVWYVLMLQTPLFPSSVQSRHFPKAVISDGSTIVVHRRTVTCALDSKFDPMPAAISSAVTASVSSSKLALHSLRCLVLFAFIRSRIKKCSIWVGWSIIDWLTTTYTHALIFFFFKMSSFCR